MAEATTPDPEQHLSDYDDLFSGDLSKLDVVSESISFYSPVDEIHGRDALEETIREIKTAFPDVNVETNDVLASDEILMYEFTWTGTHEGEFDGVPPTGREVEISGMAKLTFSGGKVQEDRTYFDSQELQTQLGESE